MVIQTTEENKREEEIYTQEAAELEDIVSELQAQKDKLPDDEERLMGSLREKRELCEDREHRKYNRSTCLPFSNRNLFIAQRHRGN